MSETLHLAAGPEDAGARLDRFLAQRVEGWSRTALARLVESGRVQVDGARRAASFRLAGGERVEVVLPDPEPSRLAPEALPLAILHEDEDLLALDKPAGLVVHPGAGAPSGTLVNALVHHLGDRILGVGGERRPGIVHRLDKGTTGVMVVAKTPSAHAALSAQFAGRTVVKVYLAVVLGRPPATGAVDLPISRSRAQRTRMAAVKGRGRAARTTWRRIEDFGGHAALLEVLLETGRTHQVRVHLAAAGHPLVGDAAYGGRRGATVRDARVRAALALFPRPALHAHRLEVTHPRTGERLVLVAPIPADLGRLLHDLREACRPAR